MRTRGACDAAGVGGVEEDLDRVVAGAVHATMSKTHDSVPSFALRFIGESPCDGSSSGVGSSGAPPGRGRAGGPSCPPRVSDGEVESDHVSPLKDPCPRAGRPYSGRRSAVKRTRAAQGPEFRFRLLQAETVYPSRGISSLR